MRKWLTPVAMGVGVIALVVIALNRTAPQLDLDTPEGAVQEYLRAISVEDYDAAFAVLDPDEFSGCDADDIARNVPDEPFSARLNDEDGFIREFDIEPPNTGQVLPGDVEYVSVIFEFGTPGPFGGTWESWESFQLIESDGDWWIVGDPWPYFSWSCRQLEG